MVIFHIRGNSISFDDNHRTCGGLGPLHPGRYDTVPEQEKRYVRLKDEVSHEDSKA